MGYRLGGYPRGIHREEITESIHGEVTEGIDWEVCYRLGSVLQVHLISKTSETLQVHVTYKCMSCNLLSVCHVTSKSIPLRFYLSLE